MSVEVYFLQFFIPLYMSLCNCVGTDIHVSLCRTAVYWTFTPLRIDEW